MLKGMNNPDFFCYNCGKKINTNNPSGCCENEKCQEEYWRSFKVAAEDDNESTEKRGWAFYLLAKAFADDSITLSIPEWYDQMIENYWDSAFLGNKEARHELARLFENNDDELSLATASVLNASRKCSCAKEYLKKIRETEPRKIFEIALNFENSPNIPNNREYAYKFYRKLISSKEEHGLAWKCKAIVNLVQMMMFDRLHRDDMYNALVLKEPQLGAEIVYWLDFAKQYDDETKSRADKLYLDVKKYFQTDVILSKYFVK